MLLGAQARVGSSSGSSGTSSCHEIAANWNPSAGDRLLEQRRPARPVAGSGEVRVVGVVELGEHRGPIGAREGAQRRGVADGLVDRADRAGRFGSRAAVGRARRRRRPSTASRCSTRREQCSPSSGPTPSPRQRHASTPCSRHLVSMPISTAGSSTRTSKLVWRGRSPSSFGSTTCANSSDGASSAAGGSGVSASQSQASEGRGWPPRRAGRPPSSWLDLADRCWRCQGPVGESRRRAPPSRAAGRRRDRAPTCAAPRRARGAARSSGRSGCSSRRS